MINDKARRRKRGRKNEVGISFEFGMRISGVQAIVMGAANVSLLTVHCTYYFRTGNK
jgi:hypothetical protein